MNKCQKSLKRWELFSLLRVLLSEDSLVNKDTIHVLEISSNSRLAEGATAVWRMNQTNAACYNSQREKPRTSFKKLNFIDLKDTVKEPQLLVCNITLRHTLHNILRNISKENNLMQTPHTHTMLSLCLVKLLTTIELLKWRKSSKK